MHRKLAYLSFYGSIYFVFACIAAHVCRPDLNVFRSPLSLYALGDFGFVIMSGFFVIGATQILICINTLSYEQEAGRIGAFLLAGAGVGVVIVGLFRMDTGTYQTAAGVVHIIGAGIQFFLFPLAAMLYRTTVLAFRFRVFSITTGSITLVFYVLIAYLTLTGHDKTFQLYGLIQKLDVAMIVAWLILVSLSMTRNPGTGAESKSAGYREH